MTDSTIAGRQPAAPAFDVSLLRPAVLFAPFVVFTAHTLEEFPQFATWVSEHFAPMSTENFALVHIPLILIVLACSWRALSPTAAIGWVVMVVAFQWQFAVNAVFHLAAAAWFGDYSPGMVTAATVALPVTVVVLAWVRRHRLLDAAQLGAALAIGTGVAAAAIGVLFLG